MSQLLWIWFDQATLQKSWSKVVSIHWSLLQLHNVIVNPLHNSLFLPPGVVIPSRKVCQITESVPWRRSTKGWHLALNIEACLWVWPFHLNTGLKGPSRPVLTDCWFNKLSNITANNDWVLHVIEKQECLFQTCAWMPLKDNNYAGVCVLTLQYSL